MELNDAKSLDYTYIFYIFNNHLITGYANNNFQRETHVAQITGPHCSSSSSSCCCCCCCCCCWWWCCCRRRRYIVVVEMPAISFAEYSHKMTSNMLGSESVHVTFPFSSIFSLSARRRRVTDRPTPRRLRARNINFRVRIGHSDDEGREWKRRRDRSRP